MNHYLFPARSQSTAIFTPVNCWPAAHSLRLTDKTLLEDTSHPPSVTKQQRDPLSRYSASFFFFHALNKFHPGCHGNRNCEKRVQNFQGLQNPCLSLSHCVDYLFMENPAQGRDQEKRTAEPPRWTFILFRQQDVWTGVLEGVQVGLVYNTSPPPPKTSKTPKRLNHIR